MIFLALYTKCNIPLSCQFVELGLQIHTNYDLHMVYVSKFKITYKVSYIVPKNQLYQYPQ
jgi:hypothetical protein